MYTRIVAGTDLSSTAKVATDRAARLATRLSAELVLVHAGRDPGDGLRDLGDEYGAKVVVEPGNPADVLISQVEAVQADLLVVGSVGMSGARRFLLGSVPNKVSHHAVTDLLIVKTDPPPKKIVDYEKLLVGTDGSPTAMRAVEATARLAATLGITPLIVCAYQPPTEEELQRMRRGPGDALDQWKAGRVERETPEPFRWRIAEATQAGDVLDRAQEHSTRQGVSAAARSVEGDAAEALLSIAEEEGIDLVAVGSVGMSGTKRFMLGNVPNRISHHATTDVLILKTA